MRRTTPRRTRKAMAGVVVAMLLFAMLFTAVTSYFVFANTANQVYGTTLANRVNNQQASSSESLQLVTVLTSGDLGFYAINPSNVNVRMIQALVTDTSGKVKIYDFNPNTFSCPSGVTCGNTPGLPVTVNRGTTSATMDTGFAYTSGTYTVKVMTDRGNTFSANFPQTGPAYAYQAQSIGALTATLQTFKWLSPSGTQQSGGQVSGFPTIGLSANTQGYVPITITNSQTVPAIALDGSPATAYCSSTNQCQVSITTYNSYDVIYVAISDSSGGGQMQQGGVSDDASLTWNQRAYKGTTNIDLYTYYAVAPSAFPQSENIYVQLQYCQSSCPNIRMIAIAISNANTAAPFDSNLGSAVTAINSGSGSYPATLNVVTKNPTDLVLGTVMVGSHSPSGAGGSWSFTGCCSGSTRAGLEYQIVTSTGTYTPSFSWGSYNDYWAEIGDAIQQATTTAATPNPFQQMITWNPSAYTNYESSDLGNIRFCSDSGCTQLLHAWLESCTPSCSNGASSATAWVKLTSSIAGSGGSLTIYMGFQSSCTEFDGNNWGEAPQLSPAYAQYDNGAKVFAAYFNGNNATSSFSVRSGFSLSKATGVSYTSGTVNALLLTGYHSNDVPLVFSTQLSNTPMVAESNFESVNYGTDSGVAGFADSSTASSVSNAIGTNVGWQSAYFNQDYLMSGSMHSGVNNWGGASTTWLFGSATYLSYVGSYYGYIAPQLYSTSQGYGATAIANPLSTPTYTASHLYLAFVYTTNSGATADMYYNWGRARINPPNSVMPYTTFGSFVPPGGTGYLIFSATFTDQDQMGRGVTLWPDSSVAIITTTQGGQTSSVVTNFYIVQSLSGGTNPTGVVAYNYSADFVHIPFQTPTTVYFAASAPKGGSMVLLNLPGDPFQILITLSGQFDDSTLYGQTIPFPAGVITKAVASLSAYSGNTNSPISVSGGCFAGGSKAIVGWMGSDGKITTLNTFSIPSSGTISNVNFQVPACPAGVNCAGFYYTVVVTDFENTLFFVFQHG